MKKIFITLLFTVLLSSTDSFAQLDFQKEGFSVRGALTNFEFIETHKNPLKNTFTGVEVAYLRKLSQYTYLTVPLRATLADLPADADGLVRKDEFLTSLGVNFQVMNENIPGRWFQPFAYLGFDFMHNKNLDNNLGIPVGAGFNIRMGNGWALNWSSGFRADLTDSDYASLEHRFGIVVGLGDVPQEPEIPDTDMDGINDVQDQCPNTPGLASLAGCPDTDGDGIGDNVDGCPDEAGIAALNGCPDKDEDGIADKDDACPDVAGIAALNGCPDSDGDGIGDAEDKCPKVAGTAATNGCPDADGDGVVDSEDECPNKAGIVAMKGCPDSDGDGVTDSEDECPSQAGSIAMKGCPDSDNDGVSEPNDKCPTVAGPASNSGCPELTVEEKETLEFAKQAIQFETGSATIKTRSYDILNKVSDILLKYKDYQCDISGHTDSVGNTENNQALSEKRAKSCYDYLISRGIPSPRLKYAGYGETKPIADNKYKAGRDQNRRVEFDIHP